MFPDYANENLAEFHALMDPSPVALQAAINVGDALLKLCAAN